MELILFDESHRIKYFGECTIKGNTMNGHLMVTPTEEDFKVCPYVFKQDVIKQNNFLFVFASNLYPCDFVLIFSSTESCNKIFEGIQKARDPNENQTTNAFDVNSAEFQQRFFVPILEICQTKEAMSSHLKEFICNILKSFGKDERKKYLVLIKEKSDELYSEILKKGKFDQICRDDTIANVVEDDASIQPDFELIETGRKLRKRRRNEINIIEPENNEFASSDEDYQIDESDMSYSDEDFDEEMEEDANIGCNYRRPKRFKPDIGNDIVEAPDFKLLTYDEYGTLVKKLFIFPTEDKTMCYVYGWSNTVNQYVCWRCNHYGKGSKEYFLKAVFNQENQNQGYIKLNRTQHVCGLIKYEPEKYTFDASKQIVLPPKFEIFKFEEFGVPKSRLVLFPNDDRELCYEYGGLNGPGHSNSYYCLRCYKIRYVKAVVCKNERTNEVFLKLRKAEHICNPIKFDPEKYKFNEAERIVKSPNFKVISYKQKGEEKMNLFIYTSLEDKLGYDFYYSNSRKIYFCCGCTRQKALKTAKLCIDKNGENCVMLNKFKHVCKSQELDSEKYLNHIFLYKPTYEIREYKVAGVMIKKLILFIPEHRELCYEMLYNNENENFCCHRCGKDNNRVRAYACTDDDGNEFISVYERAHICAPIQYLLENYQENQILRKPNYQLLNRKVKEKMVEKLVIFANKEKTLSYEYTKIKNKPSWQCNACQYQAKVSVLAKIIEAKDGEEEYVELSKNQHQCEPKKFVPEEAKLNIIKKPGFKLEVGRINYRNKETKRITIFDRDDPTLCYYYMCIKGENLFRCARCARKGIYVGANLIKPKNGEEEEYLILNENQHICKIEKYSPINSSFKIVNLPDFYFEKSSRGNKDSLVVKSENNSNLWYTYGYAKDKDAYLCNKCQKKNKYVSAKLWKVEDGDDYIELGPNEHVCKPEKKKKN